MENNKETIICPNCGTIQEATVDRDVPFAVLIHDCDKCGYRIMESEWEVVDPTLLGPIQPISEETASELADQLLKSMNEAAKQGVFMLDELKKYFNEMVCRIYRQLYIDKTILVAASLAYGFKLDSCWRISRWYWRRRMNKANKAIEQLDVKLTEMEKEYPDICKPILIDM